MVRGCPVLVALRAWRPASRPTLPNSRAIGCRCAMKAEQAGENAKGIVRLCGAHPVRRPLQRRARAPPPPLLSGTPQNPAILGTERTAASVVFATRVGGR